MISADTVQTTDFFLNKFSLNLIYLISFCLSQEVTSYRWKVRLFLFNISCCLAAAYFFRRHNKHCEAGGECPSPESLIVHRMILLRCSLPVPPPSSLHPVRPLWVPGCLLQHGLPHDGLLGLREQRGDRGHAAWRQTILSSSLKCWLSKKRWIEIHQWDTRELV